MQRRRGGAQGRTGGAGHRPGRGGRVHGIGHIQPVRRLRTRPLQGRKRGSGGAAPGDGTGRGGGGEKGLPRRNVPRSPNA
ncbi:hypothetical protein DMH25_41070 [Streptomyces sp. WAC 01325]|nr:hypothetical protein DMH25_41070 [Streptomyces sp. WAC 01325]